MIMVRANEARLCTYLGVLCLLILGLIGCAPEAGNSGQNASRLTLKMVTENQTPSDGALRTLASGQSRLEPGDPGFITRFDLRIEAADLTPAIERSFSLSVDEQTEITRDIEVPVGLDRRIIVTVFNANDVKLYSGETTVDLTLAAQTVTITLVRQDLIPAPVTPANVTNRTFTLADGAAFGLTGVEVTIAFGAFEGNTGVFALSSGGFTASGSVTIVSQSIPNSVRDATVTGASRLDGPSASCSLEVAASTYPSGQGPQTGESLSLACQTDAVDGRLIVENTVTAANSTSLVPTPTTNVTFSFILDVSRLDDASQRLP